VAKQYTLLGEEGQHLQRGGHNGVIVDLEQSEQVLYARVFTSASNTFKSAKFVVDSIARERERERTRERESGSDRYEPRPNNKSRGWCCSRVSPA